jgi:hypothetical protein
VVLEDVTASYRNGVSEPHLPVAGTDRDGGHRIDMDMDMNIDIDVNIDID